MPGRIPLPVVQQVRGALFGPHRDRFAGAGEDDTGVAPYRAGDDVRRLDWALLARTGEPYVRRPLASREAVLSFAVDATASMWFATRHPSKVDVAMGVGRLLTLAALGDVRSVAVNRGGLVRAPVPPRAALAAWRDPGTPEADAGSFATALRHARQAVGDRGIVVAISDFQTSSWFDELARAGEAAVVVAVHLTDRRERDVPLDGSVWLEDPETGRQLLVDRPDDDVRRRVERALADRHDGALRVLRRCTPWTVDLVCEPGWQAALAAKLRRVAERRR